MPFLHAAAGNAIEQTADSVTTKVLAQTYREKMEASDAENPFVDEDPDPERYKAILARQEGREARDAERQRAGGRGRPGFAK